MCIRDSNKYSPPTALAIVLDGEYPESPKSNSLRNLIGSTCGSMGFPTRTPPFINKKNLLYADAAVPVSGYTVYSPSIDTLS